jgi:RiboL-PSP-HEPN
MDRTAELRRIVATIEALSKDTTKLQALRPYIDLSKVGLASSNTVNAMSLVFLASSFEEFVREEIKQCSTELASKYHGLPADLKHAVRNVYWTTSLDRMKFIRTILTRQKPKALDPMAISKLRVMVDCTKGFVVDDDPALLDVATMAHHSNNFKPHVVDELSSRIGIKSLIDSASDHSKLKTYFGTSTRVDTSERLKVKLNEFYDRRNEIVHSLSAVAGYGVDSIIDYVDFFEALADCIKTTLVKAVAKW